MKQIVRKFMLLLVTMIITSTLYVLSPKALFMPILGLVASTTMVGICTNTCFS